MTEKKLERILHNFYTEHAGGAYTYQDILTLKEFLNHLVDLKEDKLKTFALPKYKVGLMFVCINPPYWEFAKEVIEGARQFFLPDHDVEMMVWSDMPKETIEGVKVFETEPIEWPYPTLMRYNLFLQEEEYLQQFDYIFYCDSDMKFVNLVGDEVLGEGLTAAQHPMYALRKEYWPPYEPNEESAAYIRRTGRVIDDNGAKRFQPLYFAGGFQGGKTAQFIEAMKTMRKNIDTDFVKNYIAIWNDESHWNKYLYDNPPSVVLSPSYIYPDSLINEYYVPLWGKNYPPKLITLTKKFTLTKEGGDNLRQMLNNPPLL